MMKSENGKLVFFSNPSPRGRFEELFFSCGGAAPPQTVEWSDLCDPTSFEPVHSTKGSAGRMIEVSALQIGKTARMKEMVDGNDQ